ncbi:hypothetical protein BDA96_05G165400 [Sorghum bicolor]|uniref:Agenet domain-containing protein n=1 Tax=Sorghum bicolor TaxID=4558 RepID=A0A921R0T7_SORBI|nr:hypothetical protein BDA96_05G165400 [Sorghum bicolor]
MDPSSPIKDMGLLLPGAEVEVRLDGKGYYGTWCEATIVDFAAARGGNAPMRYRITFDGKGEMQFDATHVRPRPPALELPPDFRRRDIVEVIHEHGWWSGLVLSADRRSVTVAFPITREVITYMPSLVRPRRDYIDGDWVPSRAVVAVRPKHEIMRYEVGEEVEVVREREVYGHSWFPAKVAEVIDEFSYIVKYSNQNWEEGGSSEYLHWQFIRPDVQHLAPENEFHLQLGPRAAVEAHFDGAWSAGLVHRIHEDGMFVVRINGRQGKQLMTKEVRPQYKWDGRDWSIVSNKRQANFKQASLASGKRPKSHVEVPFNDDEHIHDAEYSCPERPMRAQQKLAVLVQDSENASVSKMGTPLSALVSSTCPPNSCSPLHGHSTHKKIVVSGNVQNQLEKKRAPLRKVLSSKRRLSKKNEGSEGPHSLHGPLELSSTGQKIGVNEIAGSQREPSLVLERSESTQQQLDSTIENAVNADEIKHQEPVGVVPKSFASASDDIGIHEGLTAQDTDNSHTLTMAFDVCVETIRKSNIADNDGSFQEKKRTLAEIKKNGFDVQHFECLLNRLIKLKDQYNKHLEEKSEVQKQKQQTMNSLSQNDSLLCEIDNDIAELEKRLGLLRQKGQLIEKVKVHDQEKLSSLNEVESNIEEALDVHTLLFNGILAEVKEKSLT